MKYQPLPVAPPLGTISVILEHSATMDHGVCEGLGVYTLFPSSYVCPYVVTS